MAIMGSRGQAIITRGITLSPVLVLVLVLATTTSASATAAAAAASSEPPLAPGWEEHKAPSGQSYYYNPSTKESVWVRPVAKTAAAGSALAAPQSQPAAAASAAMPWRECTADTGMPYYYNEVTGKSVWVMPPEYKAYIEAKNPSAKPAAAAAVPSPQKAPAAAKSRSATRAKPAEKAKPVPVVEPVKKEPVVAVSKDEARNLFKVMLSEARVNPRLRYDEVEAELGSDPRFSMLRSVAERRALYGAWSTSEMQRRSAAAADAKKAVFDNFLAMVKDLDGASKTYAAFLDAAADDPRLIAVDSVSLRESLFDDCVRAILDAERDAERDAKAKAEAEFVAFMASDSAGVTKDSTWFAWLEAHRETLARFHMLPPLRILDGFADTVRKLEDADAAASDAAAAAAYREHRKKRDAFRLLLAKHTSAIRVTTKWDEFVPAIAAEPALRELLGTPGSTPRELFDDFIADKMVPFLADLALVKSALHANGVVVTPDTTEAEFNASLTDLLAANKLSDDSHLADAYQYMVEHASMPGVAPGVAASAPAAAGTASVPDADLSAESGELSGYSSSDNDDDAPAPAVSDAGVDAEASSEPQSRKRKRAEPTAEPTAEPAAEPVAEPAAEPPTARRSKRAKR
ncbi:uncharacterized protein AMSG_03372 [Thecamonas trahens ATCC 50062]|uniref:WW domain-containing protein n=1 Tax=Thecamonas trahens ATCC 50062 TaxID=461836 RepID=A0A0L0D3R1_THETB|nr:hypothetical protein AMSG_03372 [Thecamonas trahens ATCC 50062]KNC46939.1 hypothetical protein AMSG_03372 [Thecamonas trahens ATCC 50062]|eukprot:XP_013760211.1 hypothetical protein AMSG_03372 [Thecamonas trahens ATCC 50062]